MNSFLKVTVQDGGKTGAKQVLSLLISMLLPLFSHRMDIRCFLPGLGPGKKMCRPELLLLKNYLHIINKNDVYNEKPLLYNANRILGNIRLRATKILEVEVKV